MDNFGIDLRGVGFCNKMDYMKGLVDILRLRFC